MSTTTKKEKLQEDKGTGMCSKQEAPQQQRSSNSQYNICPTE
jgi:hypothetical protein